MVGTTRGRISHFMNKFRKLGYINYNGNIAVYRSLSNVLPSGFGNLEDMRPPSKVSDGRIIAPDRRNPLKPTSQTYKQIISNRPSVLVRTQIPNRLCHFGQRFEACRVRFAID